MATERLPMRNIREILRYKWSLGRSHREVAASLGVSVGAVSGVERRARAAGLDWAAAEAFGDDELETRLYGDSAAQRRRPLPDPVWIHTERKRPGVTLELLHTEYREQHADGYGYTQFCERYRQWCSDRRLSMVQVHRAGEKLFVDYAGKKPTLTDPATGERREVELFVAVLGASNLTYVEASESQQIAEWIASHVRAFEYLGGVTAVVVPDQLKSGVTRACRYEPEIQRSYEEMARHYGTVILPARPASPRDKAKVEVGVQIVERWILARLRHETFFTLHALNERIAELLEDLNARTMRRYRASRRALFEQLDRPALKPLPAQRFEHASWKLVRPSLDYHVELDGHYYSVPFTLRHERLELRHTATTVEVFHRGDRVASHLKSATHGRHTTVPEHMPRAHQAHLEWSPARLMRWGQGIGANTGALVEAILAARPHPEQGYRSCLGLLRLGKRYGNERLEIAAARARAAGAKSYRHVDSILKHGLDRLPAPDERPHDDAAVVAHDNLRGAEYYREGGTTS
ncbi:MAG: IS21 family transposase [Candidatus Eisenbacteria bacterium]|nr:IS21 family transposase [Candidatus Eisenbacteria bacterium]